MTLAELQRWFQSHVADPHARPRVAVARQPAVGAVIRPSHSMRPPARLAVYTRMYWLRLFEVLGKDYPTVRELLGAADWERCCRRYLTAHPSRSWSLGPLGAQLPDFLAGPVRLPRRALCRDVARIEWAMQEVFDAARCPVLPPEAFASVPAEAWPGVRLPVQGALRLLELGYRANECISAVQNGEPLPPLGRHRSWCVVWRQHGRAWRRGLSRSQFAGLQALASGGTVAEALEAMAEHFEGDDGALEQALFGWFREWVADGLFGAIMAP